MKKIFSVIVSLFMLLLLPGVSVCGNVTATPGKTGVVKASEAKKKVVSKVKSVQKGPYVSGQLGMTFMPECDSVPKVIINYKPGFASDVAVGYKYGRLRTEGEIGYQMNAVDDLTYKGRSISVSGDMTALSFLANVYIDFFNRTAFTPYITAGIGVAELENSDFTVAKRPPKSADVTVFAYQVGFGVGYKINKQFTIDLKYRLFATEDPQFGKYSSKFASNNIYCGLRYNF